MTWGQSYIPSSEAAAWKQRAEEAERKVALMRAWFIKAWPLPEHRPAYVVALLTEVDNGDGDHVREGASAAAWHLAHSCEPATESDTAPVVHTPATVDNGEPVTEDQEPTGPPLSSEEW